MKHGLHPKQTLHDALNAPARDDLSLASIKTNDVVHVCARVVEVFDDCVTVDVIGSGARFRIHPRASMIAAVVPCDPECADPDVIERLCGSEGRIIDGDLMRSRRVVERHVITK